jgi:hypothetical protein
VDNTKEIKMEDKLKEIYEKVTDVFFGITKKMDDMSERIFEETGKKINIKLIVLGVMLVIFVIIFVKSFLGWLWTLL